jgi:hypothetical protein
MPDNPPMFETPRQESTGRWRAVLAAAVLIGAALGAAIFFSDRPAPKTEQLRLDPYSENLQVGGLKLSVATNFVGSSVHYLEGQIANTAGRTVTGITVEVVFRDSLGQIVLRDTQPVMLVQPVSGDLPADVVSLAKSPLRANQLSTFRLSFEHMPAGWNGGYPELRFVKISFE